MSSPFPLLRLPRLVLLDVFKSLSIGEKIKLFFCSKKISNQFNNARLYSQKVTIVLDMLNQKIRVLSENNKDVFEIFIYPDSGKNDNSEIQQYSIACCTMKVISIPIGIETFWKNQQEGRLSVIRHLLNMFQCKISTGRDCWQNDLYQPIISELFYLQVRFKELTIGVNGFEEHNFFNQISSNFGLVDYLQIVTMANSEFTPVFPSWPQKINITNSYWFTLEYLLVCTCTTIILCNSRLGNKDLDELLRNWKAGGFPNLKDLYVKTNNVTAILGVNLREFDEMVIQTDDGSKKAAVWHGVGRIRMSVAPI